MSTDSIYKRLCSSGNFVENNSIDTMIVIETFLNTLIRVDLMAEEKNITVNNRQYTIALNDQTQLNAMKLRRLYQQSYSDMDSFDEVSSEISNTINNLLKKSVTPDVLEEDMDGAVQQILKMYEKKTKK